MALNAMSALKSEVVIDYTNWRGERRKRRIAPALIFWGSTEWHPEEQWLLLALELDPEQERVFALKDIHSWQPALAAAREPIDSLDKPC